VTWRTLAAHSATARSVVGEDGFNGNPASDAGSDPISTIIDHGVADASPRSSRFSTTTR